MITIGTCRFRNDEFGGLFSKEMLEIVQPEFKIITNDRTLADSFSRLKVNEKTRAHVIKNNGVNLLSRILNLLQAELGIRETKEQLLNRLFDNDNDFYLYFQALTLSLKFKIVTGSTSKDLVNNNTQSEINITTVDSDEIYSVPMPKFAFESLISMAAAKYTVAEYSSIRSDIIQSIDNAFPAVDENERRDMLIKLLWLSTTSQSDRGLLDAFINIESMSSITFTINKEASNLLSIRVKDGSDSTPRSTTY
ncbi:hypothetical protein [Moritella sp. F3]|uniref:hypothetical protein n=1 Tax=Moritella sp. F3 TaxID=2718882 RepID=UPI0018E10269|nr:hypothetical protein [Moritella sp. F3]GIC77732.1 hypothetical protein FMO001_24590 [Moritella sp. F1]GIC82145.1 hypothetical protein FMO003_24260 [Moritella sp. F3]